MLGQLVAAQFDLESAIAELARNHAPTDAARAQLEALGDLQRQIAGAGPAALTSLRSEIAVATTAIRALAQQGRASSLSETEAALATASARTRATVQRIAGDLFERRIFDPYLQFDSDEEREAYRRREAERQEYIRRELAKDTPQGNLNASAATLGQVLDAGAHGAKRSADYAPTLDAAGEAYTDERNAMIAAGRSTAEGDARVAAEVRRALQARGLSEIEIDARLTAVSNPVDALQSPAGTLRPEPAAANSLDAAAAALRAAGVIPPPASAPPGHGLSADARPPSELTARL